jgi:hypothetical protein
MERFNKKVAAIIDLQQRSYDLDFILNNENLLCVQHCEPITPDDFEITEVHHFQDRSGPKENYVICAVTSVHQDLKGILMTSYGAFTKHLSFHLWYKLSPAFN